MIFLKGHLKNKKGFTLIELIVVVAVLGILASIAVPRVGGITQRAKDVADKAQIRILQEALERYIAESGDEDLDNNELKNNNGKLTAESVIDALKSEIDGEYGPYLKGDVTTTLPSGEKVKFDDSDYEFYK